MAARSVTRMHVEARLAHPLEGFRFRMGVRDAGGQLEPLGVRLFTFPERQQTLGLQTPCPELPH